MGRAEDLDFFGGHSNGSNSVPSESPYLVAEARTGKPVPHTQQSRKLLGFMGQEHWVEAVYKLS